MNTRQKATYSLIALALAAALFRLKSAPAWIAVAFLPTLALVAMIQWRERLAALPTTHWLRRIAFVNDVDALVRRTLALPQSMRVLTLAGCLAWCYVILVIVMPEAVSV